MPPEDFLSREEILGGLPAKRAQTLLFLIENRVGLLAAKSKRAMALFFGEENAKEIETAFLEAFSTGRTPPEPPTVRDIERFATDWVRLIPENPRVRAALACQMSKKYVLTYRDIPKIRVSLGLDEEPVQEAFQRLYNRPLAAIYRMSPRLVDRLLWTFSRFTDRIDSLPPFWTAFSLTLTETVGAAVLALPIALAKVGPVVGGLLLIGFGLVNVVTIGLMSEAIVRSGTIRYGNAFLGQVLADYLGPVASIVLSSGLGLICFLALQAYYIGFSTTLADAIRIPPWITTAALFAIGMYYISRESLASTVASALLVGGVNMAIILFISAMAFGKLNPELYRVTPLSANAFDFSILELIFGVILAAYFGHLSIANCARIVLRQDPSGRSLLWGSMASMTLTIVIYCIWVLAVNGAVEPGAFEGLPGTAFTPLVVKIGPVVVVLGSVFVILGMGMASIHFSLGLFNIVGERLRGRRALTIALPRRNGRIIFSQRGREARTGLRMGLTYIGLKGANPCFLMEVQSAGEIYRQEIASDGILKLDPILERFPNTVGKKAELSVEVLEAEPEFARLRCDTPLSVTFEGDLEQVGIRMADMLDLPEEERKLLNHMLRSGGVDLDQAAILMKIPRDKALEGLKKLAERGFILQMESRTGPLFRALVAPKRTRSLPEHIWKALGETAQPSAGEGGGFSSSTLLSAAVLRFKSFLLSERGRFGLRISPIAAAFLVTEWMLYTGKGSFSGVLNLLGVIVVPLLGGIFPVLMLAASRRKGEYIPGIVLRFFGNPLLLTGIYLLFLSSLFAYGLFIYREPAARAAVLLVGSFVPALTIWIVMKKGFVRRITVELRWTEEQEGKNLFKITRGGEPLETEVSFAYRDRVKTLRSSGGMVERTSELKSAVFLIPTKGTGELKVLAHTVTADGSSSPLEGILEVSGKGGDGEPLRYDLKLTGGSLLMPIDSNSCRVTFTFHKPSSSLPEP